MRTVRWPRLLIILLPRLLGILQLVVIQASFPVPVLPELLIAALVVRVIVRPRRIVDVIPIPALSLLLLLLLPLLLLFVAPLILFPVLVVIPIVFIADPVLKIGPLNAWRARRSLGKTRGCSRAGRKLVRRGRSC